MIKQQTIVLAIALAAASPPWHRAPRITGSSAAGPQLPGPLNQGRWGRVDWPRAGWTRSDWTRTS